LKDTLIATVEWDLNFLTNILPHIIVNQLVAIPAPKEIDGLYSMGWTWTNTRYFTIQSAYNLQRERDLSIEGNWKSLWSWKGPHIIQTFMWISAHKRLLTNYRKSRWGSGISPLCPTCGNGDETIIHALRDCVQSTRVWLRLVASNHITNFFSLNCRDQIFHNLNNKKMGAHKIE